ELGGAQMAFSGKRTSFGETDWFSTRRLCVCALTLSVGISLWSAAHAQYVHVPAPGPGVCVDPRGCGSTPTPSPAPIPQPPPLDPRMFWIGAAVTTNGDVTIICPTGQRVSGAEATRAPIPLGARVVTGPSGRF